MNQVISINPSLIDAKINNRDFSTAENMRHVQDVAQSIREIGQGQPITVKTLHNGRYQLVAGETRTRACALLGIDVQAIVQDGRSLEDEHVHMLAENDGRKNTNDIEKAKGYKYHLDKFGITVEQLAKKLGKRVDFIQKRVELLTLRDDIQKFIQDGQLTINYAVHMVGLDANRQLIAMRHLRDNASPTPKWFQAVCQELLAQQSQQSLFFGLFGANEDAAVPMVVKTTMPLDPAGYAPMLTSRTAVIDEIAKWGKAAEDWRKYGKPDKASSCSAIVATLTAVLPMLPSGNADSVTSGTAAVTQGNERSYGKIAGQQSPEDKVISLLLEKGELTTAELMRGVNVPAIKLSEILDRHERDGRVAARRAGRGTRWAMVGAGA